MNKHKVEAYSTMIHLVSFYSSNSEQTQIRKLTYFFNLLLSLISSFVTPATARNNRNMSCSLSACTFSQNLRFRCHCSFSSGLPKKILQLLSPQIRRVTVFAINTDNTGCTPTKFYERLGSPKHICAPMVAQSDLPFRLMCEHLHRVDLSYTQMIHANNFAEPKGEAFRISHLDVYQQSLIRGILLGNTERERLIVTPSQRAALSGLDEGNIEASREKIIALVNKSEKNPVLFNTNSSLALPLLTMKPTIVQIAAHDPDVAVEAALLILERSDSLATVRGEISPIAAIDLNLGCPQAIARKGKYGSFLHDEDPKTAYKVLKQLRRAIPSHIGLTTKIRLPPTRDDVASGKLGNIYEVETLPSPEERIYRLIDCGVDLITIHGRTRFENKVTVGPAHWNIIERCVKSARAHSGDENYPIFANGGIETYTDVQTCLQITGASGVMSSESILESPDLFNSLERMSERALLSEPAKDLLQRQLAHAETYLDYATIFPPLPGSLGAKGGCFNVIRSHLFKFLHRYLEENPDLRRSLGDQSINSIRQARDIVSTLRLRYEALGEEDLVKKSSWDKHSSWYRRHRNSKVSVSDHSLLSVGQKKQLASARIEKLKELQIRKRRDIDNFV